MGKGGPMAVQPPLDWERLALDVGALQTGGAESGGSDLARRALGELLGAEELRRAVDYYVDCKPGAELARSVLWLVRPWAAMEHCHEIVRTSQDADRRRAAVELLRVVADERVLPWIQGYLGDADAGVQQWAAGIVDQLLWSDLVEPEECADLLEAMSRHPNPGVQRTAEWVRSFLRERENRGAQSGAADGPRE
jgi:hypothetical protein